MLTELELRHFKCFELLKLPLAPLTLLTGTNSSGKSSVLQSLVLLHQTMREHEWSTRLMLNGTALRLGTVTDVVDSVHGSRAFEIGLADNDNSYRWRFVGDRSDLSMPVERVEISGAQHGNPKLLQRLLPPDDSDGNSLSNRLCALTYLTAERVGPREVYDLNDLQTSPVVGPAGEHAVSVLHLGRDQAVLKGLALMDVPHTRLRQVEARMRHFFPGCNIDVQRVAHANAVTLGLRTSDDTEFQRPTHVGFGLTQVLPIIIAALSASKKDILLIENPEVHLHPAGQARMGQFLADVSKAGIQVIVETHSDHVLNGVRRAVKAKRISSEQVAIHFFRSRSDDYAQVVSPSIDSSGNIDDWPAGFFDQFDRDSNYFAGWGE